MNNACVVIPIYKLSISSNEQHSMDQCFKILNAHDIFFLIPLRLEDEIKIHPYVISGRAQYKAFDDVFFDDIPAYNRLMKYPLLYKSLLEYDFMLIFQLDAYVFKDDLGYWCDQGYDYIGAPLFLGHENANSESPIVGQGNGGFCLRNIKTCYKIVTSFHKLRYIREFSGDEPSFLIKGYRYIKHHLVFSYTLYPFQPIINEDLFWSQVIPENFSNFKVPTNEEAIKFSFEVNPSVLYERNGYRLPFGCHAWWKYDLEFWTPFIFNPEQ